MVTVVHVERTGAGPEGASNPFPHEGSETHALIRVDNISHILSAYGAVVAHAAIASLDLVLDRLRSEACLVRVWRPGLIEVSFGHRSHAEAMALVEALLDGLSIEAVKIEGLSLHLTLSCATGGASDEYALPPYAAAGDDEAWAREYRKAMHLAAEALAALREGRLLMGWQPVRSALSPAEVLYSEGLARLTTSRGRVLSPSLFIPALEVLGMARVFDRRIVAAVVDELERSPAAILGVNISSQSARLDAWWYSLFTRLRQRPGVAQRLIIEITETAPPAPGVSDFVSVLRGYGCRVALDDFGVGCASVRSAIRIAPDIIKIDGSFVRHPALFGNNSALLDHLIGVAGAVASIVVVEGVQDEGQSRMAADLQKRLTASGGCWQQGHRFGRVSAWRSCRYSQKEAESVQTVPLQDLSAPAGDFRAQDWFFPMACAG